MDSNLTKQNDLQPEDTELSKEPKFVGMEKNLIQIGYFSVPKFYQNKIKPKQEKVIKLTKLDSNINSHVEILAPAKIGLPTTSDLTKYLAFQDLIQEKFINRGLPINNPISFTNYDLLKRVNMTIRGGKGGSNDAIRKWMLRLKSTTVQFFASDSKREIGDAISVIDRYKFYGEKLDDGSIADCNYIWLSDWELKNLQNQKLVPIDLATYRQLENETAKMLVPHLQIWLYASRNNHIFHKNYDDFCSLLDLRQYSSKNEIIRHLELGMNKLLKFGYIKKWEISGSKASGFKISIWHGEKFFRDLKMFFVLNGGKTDDITPAEVEMEKPAISSLKRVLSSEQQNVFDKLIHRKIEEKSANEIVLKRSLEEIEHIIDYCDQLFSESPEKYKSKRGYLYTLLSDETFQVPETQKDGWREKDRQDYKEENDEHRDFVKKIWLRKQFDEYCFQQALESNEFDLAEFLESYENGKTLWQKILQDLRKQLNEKIYDAWFPSINFGGLDVKAKIIYLVAGNVNRDWVTCYYSRNIEESLNTLDLTDYEIAWISKIEEDEFEDSADFAAKLIVSEIFQQKFNISVEDFLENNQLELNKRFDLYFNALNDSKTSQE